VSAPSRQVHLERSSYQGSEERSRAHEDWLVGHISRGLVAGGPRLPWPISALFWQMWVFQQQPPVSVGVITKRWLVAHISRGRWPTYPVAGGPGTKSVPHVRPSFGLTWEPISATFQVLQPIRQRLHFGAGGPGNPSTPTNHLEGAAFKDAPAPLSGGFRRGGWLGQWTNYSGRVAQVPNPCPTFGLLLA